MSLRDSMDSEDPVAQLRTLRNVLAAEIDGATEPKDIASLSGRLHAVIRDIAERESGSKEGSFLDDFSKRRGPRGRLRVAGSSGE